MNAPAIILNRDVLNTGRLVRILRTQSVSHHTKRMKNLIRTEAESLGCEVRVDHGNVYVTKGIPDEGRVYPCVVCHTDTVHDIIPDEHYAVYYFDGKDGREYFAKDTFHKKTTGVGGDDKVGIAIALEMLDRLPVVKAVFFRDEEIGCKGARVADMAFFDDVAFVLECDRRGHDDFVYSAAGTTLHGKAFEEAIADHLKSYGYKRSFGSVTDVMALKEQGLRVAAANMSCGYHQPHTKNEYVLLDQIENTMLLVLSLCEDFGSRRWEHVYERPSYKYTGGGVHDAWGDWDRGYGYWGGGYGQGLNRVPMGYSVKNGVLTPLYGRNQTEIIGNIGKRGRATGVSGESMTKAERLRLDAHNLLQDYGPNHSYAAQVSNQLLAEADEADAVVDAEFSETITTSPLRYPDACRGCGRTQFLYDDEQRSWWCPDCVEYVEDLNAAYELAEQEFADENPHWVHSEATQNEYAMSIEHRVDALLERSNTTDSSDADTAYQTTCRAGYVSAGDALLDWIQDKITWSEYLNIRDYGFDGDTSHEDRILGHNGYMTGRRERSSRRTDPLDPSPREQARQHREKRKRDKQLLGRYLGGDTDVTFAEASSAVGRLCVDMADREVPIRLYKRVTDVRLAHPKSPENPYTAMHFDAEVANLFPDVVTDDEEAIRCAIEVRDYLGGNLQITTQQAYDAAWKMTKMGQEEASIYTDIAKESRRRLALTCDLGETPTNDINTTTALMVRTERTDLAATTD